MADIRSVLADYNNSVASLGKATLSALFPNDFELYMSALELTDSEGNVIDYLAFPVMPDMITKTTPKRTNIKKTSSGTTVLSSSSNVPSEIQLKGDFGRSFKFLLSEGATAATGVAFSVTSGKKDLFGINSKNPSLSSRSFNAGIKTGFGATKILQAILEKSNGVDGKGKPFRLFFYNMALGESYLVVVPPQGFTLMQSQEKNMIWQYSMNLTVIAPLEQVRNRVSASSNLKTQARGVIQKGVYDTAKAIRTLLQQ